jgi:uncharacterized protein YcbX
MQVGTVGDLWRYPVKSMRGEACAGLVLTPRGVAGDRVYAVLDQTSGKIASAKHPRLWGALLACSAALAAPDTPADTPPMVRITLPDGSVLVSGHDPVDDLLSAALGRAVALVSEPPAVAEIERYWPDVEGLALRDTVTAGPIAQGAPGHPFVDYAPVHLLTGASLARLRALYPAGQIDSRRFRANLLIDLAGEVAAFVENAWVGKTLLIGESVRLRVSNPAPRCVVPTLPQADLGQDVGILRALATHNLPPIPALGGVPQPSLGAYASVEQPGPIRRGDPVRLMA